MQIQCPKCKEWVDSDEERCIHCGASFNDDASGQTSDADRATYGFSNGLANRFDLGIDKRDFHIFRTRVESNQPSPPKLKNIILLFGAFWVIVAIFILCFFFLLHSCV